MRSAGRKSSAKGSFVVAAAAFIFACAIAGALCFQYYSQLQATLQAESSGYLREVSARISSNIDRIISDNYSFLRTLSSGIIASSADSFPKVQALVDEQRDYWDFQDIILIDQNCRAYNADGSVMKLDNDPDFLDAVLANQAAISSAQMINNEERIMISTPLGDCSVDGIPMIAMAASYDPATFDQTLSMSAFGGNSFSCIFEVDGTTVVRSSSEAAFEMGYNILTTIDDSDETAGNVAEDVKATIAKGEVGETRFTRDDIRYYAVYTPVAPENWYLMTFVPANSVNAKSDLLLNTTLLICGGITTVFAALVAFLLFVSTRNRHRLENVAYVDRVTGGHTITRFYELARESLETAKDRRFALVYTNLEKFKVLNEQFGRRACDELLVAFCKILERGLREGEILGRLSADNFCILIEYTDEAEMRKRLIEWFEYAEIYIAENNPIWSFPTAEFGIYVMDDNEIPFPQMIDRAKLALKESPQAVGNRVRYAVYDDEVRRLLFREKQLEDLMEQAIPNKEFKVYLQPKYKLPEREIGGAEALTRWVSESEGMIFPDEFIPLFEKNGFIVTLDLYVFDEVCGILRSWLDSEKPVMKVSVNCSRAHLRDLNFIDRYRKIAQKHGVPEHLIEIELTESIVMEDAERLIGVIDAIHEAGFECSIDDFGSGYSSLNMIQSIPADSLKLDKIFFRDRSKDPERTKSVVGSIVSMAKALSMDTIAEGVEHWDQVDMLEDIGCDYIQGYVFARPMPVDEFEELAFGEGRADEDNS